MTEGKRELDGAAASVSVIVPAHNEQRWIGTCLRSLLSQTVPPHEVIVVDDGSRDATAAIVGRFPVQLLRTRQAGAGAAKNTGARLASGDILVFCDADEVFAPDFLERLIAPLADPVIRATFPGGVRYRNAEEGLAAGWLRARGIHDGQPPRFQSPHRIPKAMRTADFRAVRGFPEVGYGEDELLGERLGPAMVVDDAHWEFTLPTGAREIFGKARWIGRGPQFARQRPALWRLTPIGVAPVILRLLARREFGAALVRLIYSSGLLVGFAERHLRPAVRNHA